MLPSMTRKTRCHALLAILFTATAVASAAQPTPWVTSWATAQQTPEARKALPD
jgi:hypothetical protein